MKSHNEHMSKQLKNILLYAGIVLFFLVLAYGFVPQVLSGKIVNQSDISGYVGMAHETNEWNRLHPEDRTAWTGSMFGGMPTTMLTGNTAGDWTQQLYNLTLTGRRPASYLFLSLLGAFLLMLSLGMNWLVAVGGAIAVTFCAYNLQIIQVGHNSKMLAMAWLPWVLAAVVWTYRSALSEVSDWRSWLPKTALGAALFAFALNFQIKANHVQISYYLAIIIFSYVLVLAVWLVRRHKDRIGRFFAASGLLLLLGLLGIGTNANRLIPTYRYTQETMRGGSDLTRDGDSSDKGLDLEYATAWSYGWEELPNLMIPDFNGGSSAGAVDPDKSETIRLLRQAGQTNLSQVAKALPLYWGPQPFTAGPMYMGAITIFLFILALGLYRGKEKWWMLIPTLIGIGLALGNHFMGFTKFWYYHVPFYNKFRTVSMALVILQYTLPMLGFLVLDRIVKAGYDRKSFLRAGLVALGVTGGFCLLCWLMPSLFGTFTSAADADMQEQIVQTLILDRIHLFRQDALVSLLLILATFALLWWAYLPKEETVAARRRVYAAAAVCALVLINMTAVGKRYLNADHFVSQRQFDNQFTERPVDQAILADPDPSYRVLDLTVNVFNDSHPSYFHKNIGGYSPVKLQRYQDLIERYLTPEINSIYRALQGATTVAEAEAALPALPVLSLLNDRYIILDENAAPLTNRNAMGNAWFVSKAVRASTADEEIALLGSADLRTEAVLGPDFADVQIPAAADTLDSIVLTEYAPNELRYHYRLSAPRAAVFSEIWYPSGWTAQADGEAVDLFRTDWTLRGAVLPAGEHDLVLRFDPPSYKLSSNVSRASSLSLILLTLLALAGVLVPGFRRKENE
ncbi:MAG: hypothetical protein IJ255_06790 [Bacteroidales bacterium]|nr:hypothetical protein [Bacteroidales bacterium]